MKNYNKDFRRFLLTKYLAFRYFLLTKLVGKDPVVMNIHITSDIVCYNKLFRNVRTVFHNNTVKQVSSRQSFVYNPNNSKHV